MYEIIDSMPLVIVGPLFSSQWGLVVGLLNGFLRLGSVVNFIMSPIIYKLKGIKVALWFATAAATCTILFAFLICICSDMDQRESSNSNVYNQLDVFKDSEADDIDSGPVIEAPVKALQNIGEQTIVILERVQYKSDPLVPLSGMDEKNAIVDNGYGNIMNQSPSISFDSPQHISYENISGDSKTVIDANVGDQGDAMPGLDDYSVHVDEENLIRRKTSPASVNFSIATCCHKIAGAMPLHMFGYQYYMFLCTGAFLYGAMVPFWFLGSKFLQDSYSLSVSHADALMLFPEGMIAVVSVPTGLLLDRHDVSTNVRLRMLSASCALLPVSYCLLANGFHVDKALLSNRSQPFGSSIEESYHHDSNLIYVSPTVTMCIIGVAYAVSNSLYWSTIMAILPKGPHLSPSNGLIASCLNILPSVVPPILVYVTAYGNLGKDFLLVFPMYLLSGLGCCAAGFSLVASFCKNTQPFPPNIEIGDNGS